MMSTPTKNPHSATIWALFVIAAVVLLVVVTVTQPGGGAM